MIEQVPLINDEIIEQLQFLSEDDPAFVHQLIQTLDQEMIFFKDHIGGWLQQSDYSAIAKTAHKLVGASANLGAWRLSKTIASIENASRNSDASAVKENMKFLVPTITQSIQKLKEIFAMEQRAT